MNSAFLSSTALSAALAFAGAALPDAALAETLKVQAGANLREALDRAQELRRTQPQETVVVELAAGEYLLPETLRITAADSGTPEAPLRIEAAPGARVVLRGARRLEPLEWTAWRDGIVRARASGPAFDMLWTDAAPLVRARYPNSQAGVRPYGGVAGDATSAERVAGWLDPTGGVVHGIHANRWGGMHIPILGKDAEGALRLGAPTGNNRQMGMSETERFVENVFEELDAPGEWFFNAQDGYLYLMPVGDGPPPTTLIASAAQTILQIAGDAERPVHDVIVSGLEFRNAAPSFLEATEPLLRSDWMFDRSGAVVVEGGQRVAVTESTFADLGGNAVVVSGFNREVTVSSNLIEDIGGSGIVFVGRPEAVRSPLFEYHQGQALEVIDRTPGPKTPDYPSDSRAFDNLIHDIGLIDKQATGVNLSMSARITVSHNSIYRVPRAGINVGDGTWGGHIIEDNDVFETVLETGDHGAFNSWGRDRFWHPDREEMNRRVAAEPTLITLDAMEPVTLRHNRFRSDHGWDVDLDDGSSNYIIQNNVMLAGGLKLREGFARRATNNILYNNTLHPHVWFADSQDVFERNIVMTGYQPILIEHWGRSIDYNLFVTPAALARARENRTDLNSAVGQPGFVNAAHGDFTIAAGSPALALGFVNFPMTSFGVVSPRLRLLSREPEIPAEIYTDGGETVADRQAFGMTFRTLSTRGEQSAAGLQRIAGVLVLAVDPDGLASRARLRAGDVILTIVDDEYGQSDPTDTAEEFLSAVNGRMWRGSATLEVSRNQAKQRLELPTR